MEGILQFVADYANMFIILFGLAAAIALVVNANHLSNHRNKIEEALKRKNKKYITNAESKELEEEDDEGAAITPDTIRRYEMEFNKTCSWHNVLTQLIPVFPLLGILGTVAGLMLQTKAADIAGMLDSLDVALVTTFWGLVWAILLKLLEAFYPSRIIYDVEVMLDDFDKKMSIAEMFQNYKQDGVKN